MQEDKNQIFESKKKNLKGFGFISTGTSSQTVKNLPFFLFFVWPTVIFENVFQISIQMLT